MKTAKRTRIGIVIETGEAREVHHHCLLVGYGADGINPYLAFEALEQSRNDGLLDADVDFVGDYRQAVAKGMLKVMAKMDIAEHRLPQDGRCQVVADGKEVDLRISTLPTVLGEKVVRVEVA